MLKTHRFFILIFVSFVIAFSCHAKGNDADSNKESDNGAPLYLEAEPVLPDSTKVQLPNFTSLVKFAEKAVVNIASEGAKPGEDIQEGEESEEGIEPPLDSLPPFLKREPESPRSSLGSGFFINQDGYIVTNYHVIEKAKTIIVRLSEGKDEYKAKLIGADSKTDLALIKIDSDKPFDFLPLGDSDALDVGEWVLAIGNQFQLGQTFTAGIVSAKARRIPTREPSAYDRFIQTDASINPGSSGGPLLNAKGQVVGINTAIFSPGRQQFGGSGTGFNIGIGFSVPVNLAKGIITQLKKSGRVTRGLLGVIIQAVTPDMQSALGLPKASGALVADVLDDTPAKESGFEREDVIIAFGGKPVDDHDSLPLMVAETPVGTDVEITVLRQGSEKVLKARIGELKDKPKTKEDVADIKPDRIGVIPQEITKQYSKAIGQSVLSGIVIGEIESGSASEAAGLLRGDIIEEISRKVVRDLAEYEKIITGLPEDKPILVLVRRREGTRFLTLKIPPKATTKK